LKSRLFTTQQRESLYSPKSSTMALLLSLKYCTYPNKFPHKDDVKSQVSINLLQKK